GDGAHGNRAAQNLLPKHLPGGCIEGSESTVHIAMEDQIAGGGENCAGAGRSLKVESKNLARGEIDFRDAPELGRIAARALNTDSALGLLGVRVRPSHIQTVIVERDI